MRQFAIGDIHGCLTALQVLDLELQFGEGDTVVTLGDYIAGSQPEHLEMLP